MIELLILTVGIKLTLDAIDFLLGCLQATQDRLYKKSVKSYGKMLNKVMPL